MPFLGIQSRNCCACSCFLLCCWLYYRFHFRQLETSARLDLANVTSVCEHAEKAFCLHCYSLMPSGGKSRSRVAPIGVFPTGRNGLDLKVPGPGNAPLLTCLLRPSKGTFAIMPPSGIGLISVLVFFPLLPCIFARISPDLAKLCETAAAITSAPQG